MHEEKLLLTHPHGFAVVDIQEIIRVEAYGNISRFHFIDGNELLVSKPLSQFDLLLKCLGFYRVHNSHLVNLKHVNQYIKGDRPVLVTRDEAKIPISRYKKSGFLERFMRYLVH